MQVGYARVSTKDQNLALQHEALTKAGCKKIHEDRVAVPKLCGMALIWRWKFCAKATA